MAMGLPSIASAQLEIDKQWLNVPGADFGQQATLTILNGGGTYRDEFGSESYSNSDGTEDWSATPWVETGDDDSADSGQIEVLPSGVLDLDNIDSRTISRPVNLSAFIGQDVTLTFDWTTGNDGDNDSLGVDLWNGTGWTEIASIDNNDTEGLSGSVYHSLTADQISATSMIRFSFG